MKNKISILIIAHNEESHIQKCLESISNQSKKADEVILIAHNCTDKTVEIAKKYPEIQLYEYISEKKGPITARKYGFEQAQGDIIACLDGDSYVDADWLENIIKSFKNKKINSVSGFPILLENTVFSYCFFLQGLPLVNKFFKFYFWGGNFACRRKDYFQVGGMIVCEKIKDELNLYYPTEDCILSFLLQAQGNLSFANKAKSWVYPGNFFDETNRGKKQREDLKKIKSYF